ncbi:MAG: hypothetical protein V4723_04305 [Pseudomonadota bacterium]
MKQLVFILCALPLLSACGQRGGSSQTGEKPAPDAAQVAAEVDAAQERATAAIDDAERDRTELESAVDAPRRAASYKRTMLSLIAGSYAGDCRTKSGAVARGAVTVDPDGRVSAPGLPSRNLTDPGSALTLSIKGTENARSEITFVGGDEGAQWNVSSQRKGDLTTVYSDKGNPIRCVDERPAQQGRVATLYQALAKHFEESGGAMQCGEGKREPQTVRVTMTSAGVRAGAEMFTLVGGEADEVASVNGDDGTLTYRQQTRDGGVISMTLGRSGRIDNLSVMGFRADLGNCVR